MLPKELREINPNLLKLIPRTTAGGCPSPLGKKFDEMRTITEEEKQVINLKYNIKRLNTQVNQQFLDFKKIKNQFVKKKTYISQK